MSLTGAKLVVVDKYYTIKGGYFLFGIGMGQYVFKGIDGTSLIDSSGDVVTVPPVESKKKFGGQIRIGTKSGIFRGGVNLNFSGNGIPNYLGFNLGIEPGFLINVFE